MIRAIRLAAIVASAVALGAPANAAAPSYPAATTVDLGAAKLYSNADPNAYLGGVAVLVPGGSDRQPVAQSGVAALLAEVVERTPVDGVSARDAIEAQGGVSIYAVAGPYVRFYVEARAERVPAVLGILSRALSQPEYSPKTIDAARTTLIARIADDERNPVGVGVRMLMQSYYAGAAGLPPLGTPANLAAIGPAELRAFHDATYKGGSAVLTAAGRITPDATQAARSLAGALPSGTVDALDVKTIPLATTPKRIVTHRDVGVPFVVVGFAAPPPGDRDYGAFLVMQSLLQNVFSRSSATTLTPIQRSLGTIYLDDERHASLNVYINGALTDPTLGLRELEAVLKVIALKPLPGIDLNRYKQTAEGQFVTGSLSLAEQAGQLGSFVEHGLDPNYASTALDALDRTTGADIQRVAKQYLQRFTVAVVFPREQSGSTVGN